MAKISDLNPITTLSDSVVFAGYSTSTGKIPLGNIKSYVLANLFPIPISSVTGLQAELNLKESLAKKGVANGYAGLGADGKVPAANLPAATGGGITLPIAITDVTNLATLLSSKVTTSTVGVANGVAPLDFNGKVPAANLPAQTGGITASYLTPVINFTSSSALTNANNHNKIMIYDSGATINVTLEAVEVGTTYRFIQIGDGQIAFFGTSGGQRQGPNGPYTQPAQTILSMQGAFKSAVPGASIMAVLVKTNLWHLSGALV